MFWRNRHPVSHEDLSAYADEELDVRKAASVGAHVRSCGPCHETLAALQTVRSSVSALAKEPAPRSFALRQADVEAPAAAQARAFSGAQPMLGGVAMVAAVVFVTLVAIDVGGAGDGEMTGESVQSEMPADEGAVADDADATDGRQPASNAPDAIGGDGEALDGSQEAPQAEEGAEADVAVPGQGVSEAGLFKLRAVEKVIDGVLRAPAPRQALAISFDALDFSDRAAYDEAPFAPPMPIPDESEAASDSDGGPDWLRGAEILALAVAIAGAASFAIVRWRQA
jgi:anti-sigma factor RsiW